VYLISNYDKWWKYEKVFSNFKSAFMVYQCLNDKYNTIEYIDFETGIKQVVWDKTYEENNLDGIIQCECSRRIQ